MGTRITKNYFIFDTIYKRKHENGETGWEGWNIDPETRYRIDEHGNATRYVGHPEQIRAEIRRTGFTILHEKMIDILGGMLVAAVTKA